MRWIACSIAAGLTTLAAGCAQPVGTPPVTLSEYQAQARDTRASFPRYNVVNYNLARALDESLTVDQRTASLELADNLGGGEPAVRDSIGEILGAPNTPEPLRQAALTFLLRRDAPGLGEVLGKHWAVLEQNPRMRDAAMAYLQKHPASGIFSGVVQLWARTPDATPEAQLRYKMIIEQSTGKKWIDALVSALNDPAFDAKGSAVQILARQLAPDELRRNVSAQKARDPALYAVQVFLDRLAYVPADGRELYTSVLAIREHAARFPDVQRLAAEWSQADRYRFNIRDFPLLSGLSGDVLRKPLSRVELVAANVKTLRTRKHVDRAVVVGVSNFATVVDRLTMADLWNVSLLCEMLDQPRMQKVIGLVADADRKDTRSAWGGLVFYEGGKAEPKLSPPDRSAGDNDRVFTPGPLMRRMSHDGLCTFVGHFENTDNLARSAPTDAELAAARDDNAYGLLLTTIDETHFAAQYYNPRGIVISLGVFPLQR